MLKKQKHNQSTFLLPMSCC